MSEYNLIAAIIEQAKADYKNHPEMRGEIKSFYFSEWFALITPDHIKPAEAFAELEALL